MSRIPCDVRREVPFFASPRIKVRKYVQLLAGCETILDVGCGRSSPLRFLQRGHLVGVDAFSRDLNEAKARGTHDEFVLSDVRELPTRLGDRRFDACVALDVIEHLGKEEGLALLRSLEALASRRVVVFTPNGFLPQTSREDGDYQQHLSGWTPREMRGLGYRVAGLDGLKTLRGEYLALRFKPACVWALASWLTQVLWCGRHPESAASIVCWKDVCPSAKSVVL
jgi:hypothetical protein